MEGASPQETETFGAGPKAKDPDDMTGAEPNSKDAGDTFGEGPNVNDAEEMSGEGPNTKLLGIVGAGPKLTWDGT